MGEVASKASKSTTIGDLPNVILHKILEFMPIQNAARSSILSKQWRQLWSTLPHLMFDSLFFEYASEKSASIIHKILMQHIGPILGFHLISSEKTLAQSDVDQCIIFVSNHGIQKLTIEMFNFWRIYVLPDSLFTCSTLTQLNICGRCIFKLTDGAQFPNLVSLKLHEIEILLPQPALEGFNSLTSLELISVSMEAESFVTLSSHCPLLEKLVLKYSDISGAIDAPMLRSFEFIGCLRHISFKNSPLLTKLSLKETDYYPWLLKCNIANSLESFSSLQQLSLCNNSLKLLVLGADKISTFNLHSVKRLYLSAYLSELSVACALCLLRCFSSLQYIEIQVERFVIDVLDQRSLESSEGSSNSSMTFNRLRDVKLIGATGSKVEMQFISFILAKSPILVRMVIDPWLENDDPYEDLRKTNKISAALNSFQRASSKAQVVYNVNY